MPKLLLVLAAVPLLFLGGLASADYAIVSVADHGPDGHHIVVPVPLVLARLGLAFAPDDAQRIELEPEAARHVAAVLPVLEQLRRLPDFTLAEVEEKDSRVVVRKEGDVLRVSVHGQHQEDVEVRLPLRAAGRALNSFDGKAFHTQDLVAALGQADGELVHVRDRDTEVSVRIW